MLRPATDLTNQVNLTVGGAPTNASAPLLITAAGTGDNTKVTGETVDTYASGQRGESAILAIFAHASLTATKVLTCAAEIQESEDGSSWDTAVSLFTATTVVSGTGEQFGQYEYGIKLKQRKRYIRVNVTPDLTAGATDTAAVLYGIVMGGCRQTPIS
jgi:hypothetical protein